MRIIVFLLGIGLVCFASCNSNGNDAKTENSDTILSFDETLNHGIIEMTTFHLTDTISYKGHVYKYDIVRVSDSTLALIKDAETQKVYMDNHVELSIMRDGESFYSKVFTKNDFVIFLDTGFQTNGLLEGFVFDKTTEDGLRFATSISYPQSDMYIPLTVTVKTNGSIVIAKENLIETESEN